MSECDKILLICVNLVGLLGRENAMDQNNMINVDEIMADIRKKIKDENLTSVTLSFDDIALSGADALLKGGYSTEILQSSTEYVSARCQVSFNTPVQGNPLKRFIKKVIRKLVQFYVVPIVEQQNELNARYTSAIQQVNGFIRMTSDSNISTVISHIEELEMRQLYNKREIADLNEQIRILKEELAALRRS